MDQLFFPGQQEDEEVVWSGNQHPFTLLKPSLIFLAVLLMVIFILFYWRLGQSIGLLMAIIVVLPVAIWLGRLYFCWLCSRYILTNKRVVYIQQKGFFARAEAQAQLARVQDVILEVSGFWATLFGFGNIKIQTAGTEKVLELPLMNHPREFQETMTKLL